MPLVDASPWVWDINRLPREGTVFQHRSKQMTYLYCGIHYDDSVTGEHLGDNPVLTFFVWQGTAVVSRLRATIYEMNGMGNGSELVRDLTGLASYQMAYIARRAFNDNEQLEYRKMGLIT
jgi:hypothetical protein